MAREPKPLTAFHALRPGDWLKSPLGYYLIIGNGTISPSAITAHKLNLCDNTLSRSITLLDTNEQLYKTARPCMEPQTG